MLYLVTTTSWPDVAELAIYAASVIAFTYILFR